MDEKNSIYDLIHLAQRSDKNAMEQLINRFQTTLSKYSALLHTEDAKSDLILFIIETILKLQLNEFDKGDNYTDIKLSVYISRSVKNKCLGLLRKRDNTEYQSHPVFDAVISSSDEILSDVHFFMMLDLLTEKEKQIIIMIYYYGFSVADTARLLKVSRQTVTKEKRKALDKLRESIEI